ncbi:MAG: TolC family protein [Phycisphaeraceae bacterium]
MSILLSSAYVLLIGCAQPRPFDDLWVQARPFRSELNTIRPPSDVLERDRTQPYTSQAVNPTGVITLHDAISLALQQNPTLKANGWAVTAAEAEAMQLGRPRNPTVTLGVENFGGPDRLQELPRQTLRISQVIELADKRNKRQRLGEAKQRLAAWDYEQQRIETAALTATQYVSVFIAQERVALTQQQLGLATTAYNIADERATNNVGPGYERDQATARVALIQIEVDQAEQDLVAAKADLAASWGASLSRFDEVEGNLQTQVDLPSLETLQERLQESPRIARWADEIALRHRNIALQRANAVTDPSLGGGVRYLSELDEAVGVAELNWPLPLLDRNEHGILAARLRLSQAIAQQDAAEAEASRRLTRAYSRAIAGANILATIKNKAIPAATSAYQAAQEAYDAGQAEYLTALDAERSLLELKSLELNAILAYHTAIIDLEHITASAIDTQN